MQLNWREIHHDRCHHLAQLVPTLAPAPLQLPTSVNVKGNSPYQVEIPLGVSHHDGMHNKDVLSLVIGVSFNKARVNLKRTLPRKEQKSPCKLLQEVLVTYLERKWFYARRVEMAFHH